MSTILILHFAALIALGAVLGLTGGLFGIGGGVVAIPLLTLAFHLDQATAQGTALVMMVPNLLIAWWRYARHNPAPWARVAMIAAAGTLATWASAHLAHGLDQTLLRQIFAVFLMVLALRAAWTDLRPADTGAAGDATPALPLRHPALLPLVGLAGGASMGLLGVGGGLVSTPMFSRLFGLGQRMAQSLGLALVAPSSVIALATYAGNGDVDWPLGMALAVGGAFTVAAGVALAHHLPERVLRRAFAAMMAATGLWLLSGPLLTS